MGARGRKGCCSFQAVCTLGSEPWAPDTDVVPACSRGRGRGSEQALLGWVFNELKYEDDTHITPNLMIPRDWVGP